MGYGTSIKEASEVLGITVQGVHKRISSGLLDARKVNNYWLVSDESLHASLENKPKVGRSRKGQTYVLMNRTHPVMEFSFDAKTGKFMPREVLDASRVPIGTITRTGKGSAAGLRRWWEHRSIPESRRGMDQKLIELGLADPSYIPFRNLGFSLSDQYWIQPKGENLRWEDLNYFHNEFGESGTRWDDWLGEVGLSSPDNTSEGVLSKRWICEGKARILLKGHNPWTDQQAYNEAVATALHRRLLEPEEYVAYEVRHLDGLGAVSACSCFLRDDEEYVPASLVDDVEASRSGESIYEALIRKSCNLGIPRKDVVSRLVKMIVCDGLIANSDRHLRNFGYIRNVETLEWRMAPLFDSGNSLWFDKDESEVAKGDYSFTSRPFDPNPNKQMLLTVGEEWFDLDLLEGFPEEAAEILSEGDICGWRTEYLKAGIEKRIQSLSAIWG